jgi:hypothetical protein
MGNDTCPCDEAEPQQSIASGPPVSASHQSPQPFQIDRWPIPLGISKA